MKQNDHFAPTSKNERIVTLDIIRAIALLGILSVNMKYFATPAIQAEMAGITYANTLLDQISQWFIFLFAEVKFISMFSMLFGIGFLLFMERGERRGVNVKKLFKRRLLVLLCFGLIHIFFIWHGDILTFYALLGFVLLLTKAKKPKFLLKASFITMAVPITFFLIIALLLSSVEQNPSPEQQATFENEVNRIVEVYSTGSYGEIFVQRINDIAFMIVGNFFLIGVILTMFFFGMYLWKTEIFTNTTENIARVKKIAITSLMIAIPGLILATIGKLLIDGGESPWYFVQYAGLFMSGPTLSIFYIMSLLLLFENKQRLARVARFLQPVGKMALTNYLMQSIMVTFIYYSYGFGLFGQIGPFYGLLITFGIFAVQIVYSYFWMKKFNYGPMEWLWRRLTYGKESVNKSLFEKAQ
ncbi:hypothetical protein BKP35_00775 [Anaerobacillus arseniciselenatis]|uniref:DUF418 domain-containing protein n=1 Tax=Anaerobacillus arseniciselenatis TaxID=85682 RepID=A0A1S2LSS0_9BACI|nr:DUF418 domain-containing protein [Anaerobacillus arseniciselenatis]OIJ15561.1 hypothetical protein BKP35_00775 [Anaerobacillus arseniciselenatis]